MMKRKWPSRRTSKTAAEELGNRVEKGVTAPPAPYILTCGICGASVRFDLWLDIHACDACGARTEKDGRRRGRGRSTETITVIDLRWPRMRNDVSLRARQHEDRVLARRLSNAGGILRSGGG